ncbi:PAS domain S-box protein [Oryzomonas japonica]|uniref:histidine kinase n=1 Tax=Oryzomonas japonica TaxID=2603858 RepID=A0A7J4ZMS7_9BACT|nr:ABC transporter substrate-binding protein [Oryzomonas japonica]KAB0663829.1 PAS domain S-box protein [Oryzomonas japonica]
MIHSRSKQLIAQLLTLASFLGVILTSIVCNADDARTKQPPQIIDFQLRWKHQFQFAGYYAAIEKGYYKEEGLDVRLHEGAPGKTPVQEVLAGRAQYAEANAELLHERLHGQPLVALAAIFQHSASVLLARTDTGISSPHDLIGKKVMLMDKQNDADFYAMFFNEGINPEKVNIQPSSFDINDLATGKVTAFNSYLTNEPFFLKQKGVDFVVINPINYGIDFYSDILFTSEQELKQHPKRVKAFRSATLRGWQYAMSHRDELIDLLITKYNVKKTREHLQFEADTMRQLILPDLVEMGHMNPGRWQHMADIFVKVGMADNTNFLEGFIYDPYLGSEAPKLRRIVVVVGSISSVSLVIMLILFTIQRRLRKEVGERKTAENALRYSETLLKASQHVAHVGHYTFDLTTGLWTSSEELDAIFGIDENYARDVSGWLNLICEDQREEMSSYLQTRILQNREYFDKKYQIERHSDKAKRWVHGLGRLESDNDGRILRLFGIIQDITEQQKTKEALEASERFLKTIIDSEPECIKMLDNRGNLLMMNRAGLDMVEADSFEQVKGKCAYSLITDSYRNAFMALTEQVFHGIPGILEFEITGLKGRHVWLETHAVPFRNEQGDIISLLGITRDITERRHAEEVIRTGESHYRTLFNNTLIGVAITDVNLKFTEVNEAFSNLVGYSAEELVGRMSITDVSYPDDAEKCIEMVNKIMNHEIDHYSLEKRYLSKTGKIISALIYINAMYNLDGEYVGATGSVLDITELRQAEESRINLEKQLLHSQKLESLGVLAGGIAHDFNNILMTIMGNADLALLRLNPESPSIENLHKIEQASARAADLAKQMLAYSGKGKFVIENLDMNRLLEEMLHMLEVSISKKAVLRLNLSPHLPTVEADATQMRQIVMNLVINASEAIGEKSGVIAITTGCMDCDESYLEKVWLEENITEGLYVYMEIADTGCGMDDKTQAKLFDPFFTTKFTGRGLGMAAVLGIVRGHKGAIKVYSELGKGTSFKILLPASNKPSEIFNNDNYKDDWKSKGKVLLVDDEETIRGIGKEMLQEFGFTTITANDGREAVEIFKQNSDIAFVILDLTMPHMDGEQCFRELRQIKQDVKVIMSSGFSEHEVTQKFAGKGLAGFIQKPYKLSVLKEAIQKIH